MIILAIIGIILGISKIILSFLVTGNIGKKLLNQIPEANENQLFYFGLLEGIDGIIELLLGIYVLIFI